MKAKVGIVGVANPVESGGERFPELMESAVKALKAADLEVISYPELIEVPAQAIDAAEKMNTMEVDSLVIMDITWAIDSLKYIFTNMVKVPTTYWAVPYTETFSIGCIQHYGSILKAMGYTYDYVYGLPEDEGVVDKIVSYAMVGKAVKLCAQMKIALVGPRQTWRVCGPQDMSKEEWDFSKKTGVTLVHLEMEDILRIADQYSDEEAKKELEELSARTAKSLADQKALVYMAKVYMATKKTIEDNRLTALAAECYPNYGGLMNLPSSWLADEGIVVDTEGDIGHTFIINILNLLAEGGAVALGEAGSIDRERNILPVAHEGSTAMSLAGDLSLAQINPSGELGTFVGVPLKAMDTVTVSSIVGNGDHYKVLIAKARTLPVTHEEWVAGGSKLIVNLQFDMEVQKVMDRLMAEGMDHHFVLKEGDYTKEMASFCDYMGFEKVCL